MFLPRIYEQVLRKHLSTYRQMAFVSGPRQVGKTTLCRSLATHYFNWDDQNDRETIVKGPKAVTSSIGLDRLRESKPVVVIDELHKYRRWRTFLKGFFDVNADRAQVIVTGSARLDFYSKSGDSLMGRYFPYRMHPLSFGELVNPNRTADRLIHPPAELKGKYTKQALWIHGGFPEPYATHESRFTRRWQSLRTQQLLYGDVRDLTRIQETAQLELLVILLTRRASEQITYSNLANDIQVSVDTLRRWIATLTALYHGFLVRPWFKNIKKSLRKEPKWYLRDWSVISDPGKRAENLVACHLLKATEFWTDLGFGEFGLYYLRDKEKREVDFLVVRDQQPWFMVEVKTSIRPLASSLNYFAAQLKVNHVFQLAMDMPFVSSDCFAQASPSVVPAQTFLSQLP